MSSTNEGLKKGCFIAVMIIGLFTLMGLLSGNKYSKYHHKIKNWKGFKKGGNAFIGQKQVAGDIIFDNGINNEVDVFNSDPGGIMEEEVVPVLNKNNQYASHTINFNTNDKNLMVSDEVSWPEPREKGEIKENGVICQYNKYGRLNNQLLAVRGGLVFAWLLNRTLVVPSLVSKLFDAEQLGRIYPGIAVSYDGNLCKKAKPNKVVAKTCKHKLGCDLLNPIVYNKLREAVKNQKVLGMYGNTMYRNARWAKKAPGLDLEALFYRNLYPKQHIKEIADKYIEENFNGKEFAAVHLRWLEGSCLYRVQKYNNGIGKILCSPEKKVFLEVMEDVIGKQDMPIYVASDRQRITAYNSYMNDGGYTYKGECSGYTCAVIDFEISARSNFFIGVVVSTASDTIAHLRKHRRVRTYGRQFTNVISWSRDKSKIKNGDYMGAYQTLRKEEKEALELSRLANENEEITETDLKNGNIFD